MQYDVIVIGAGAAGLMAAIQAGKRGRKTLLLESSSKIGEKIRISGGGRCNFTNLGTSPKNYISNNPHFTISPLKQYTQNDFIKLVESYNIPYHEKTLGQLFCDISSNQIIDMLIDQCHQYNVTIINNCLISSVTKSDNFYLASNYGQFSSESLIIATGGLSIPKIGASDFGYQIAKQFGLNIIPTKPSLVPLTVEAQELEFFKSLSGISINSIASQGNTAFKENILFTHRGLSGPAILQISSYITPPEKIKINLLPDINLQEILLQEHNSKTLITNFLKELLPKRFIDNYSDKYLPAKRITDFKRKELEAIAYNLHNFVAKINSTEGYLKAEVTAGGVDTKELSSKTMASTKIANLYFIGEVVDVTGWLGGYNFQWAWSSGFVAGNHA
jgi:predicted Rossmann fold flavoprotein